MQVWRCKQQAKLSHVTWTRDQLSGNVRTQEGDYERETSFVVLTPEMKHSCVVSFSADEVTLDALNNGYIYTLRVNGGNWLMGKVV